MLLYINIYWNETSVIRDSSSYHDNLDMLIDLYYNNIMIPTTVTEMMKSNKLMNLATIVAVSAHLCFKQAQPKMCHSPKVDDGVDIFLFLLLEHLFLDHFFLKNFKLTSHLNR